MHQSMFNNFPGAGVILVIILLALLALLGMVGAICYGIYYLFTHIQWVG